jgi:predicted nucleic acid-binding protein
MLAVDTNVVVRYLTGDHPEQAAKARALIDDADIFVTTSVLLETEWVLRRGYGYSAAEIGRALRAFTSLPHVTLESPTQVSRALVWLDFGIDFAGALHAASADRCDAFITFDRRLGARARRVEGLNVRLL